MLNCISPVTAGGLSVETWHPCGLTLAVEAFFSYILHLTVLLHLLQFDFSSSCQIFFSSSLYSVLLHLFQFEFSSSSQICFSSSFYSVLRQNLFQFNFVQVLKFVSVLVFNLFSELFFSLFSLLCFSQSS